MKNIVTKVGLVVATGVAMVGSVFATGTADTDVTGAVNDVVATFGTVKTAMIAIGVFLLGYAFYKKLRRS